MDPLTILAIIFISISFIIVILSIMSHFSDSIWFCKIGWHRASHDTPVQFFDHHNHTSCRRCGKTMNLTKRGNWV